MVTWDDFEKIWASTSPLTPYEFSDQNYSQGWNFVGSTPPARQMWDSIQKKNDEKFKYLRDNFGTPNIVTSSSQMMDTEKVYVYMGNEAGWNSGHWYYYDEGTSSWADGGVYNSVAFVTDTTLSIAGQPADAKAVGDALAFKADLAGCTFTGDVSVNADFTVTGASTLGDVTASSDLSVAGDSALTNLSVSGTTALAGTSTAPTPSADDNSTKIATTEYVQTEIKPIETDVDIAEKDIANIKALLQGNLYDYQTDSTSAYTKSVPSGAMPYAGIEKIGGKTIVYNQLVDSGTTTVSTISGHKYYTLIDGTASIVTSSGSAISIVDDTADMVCDLTLMFGSGNEPSTTADFTAIFGATHYSYNAGTLLSAGVTSVVSNGANLIPTYTTSGSGNGLTWTVSEDGSITINGTATDGTPILAPISSWQWDGKTPCWLSGCPNGGSTNSYFLDIYGEDEWGSYQLSKEDTGNGVALQSKLSWDITNIPLRFRIVIISGTQCNNLTFKPILNYGTLAATYAPYIGTISTYSIPAEVQALEGYGWSAGGTVSNYIDLERKKLVKRVDRVDLGTLNYLYLSDNILFATNGISVRPNTSPIICSKFAYLGVMTDVDFTNAPNLSMAISGVNPWIKFKYTDTTDPNVFKSAMSGIYLYYELTTPIEIDISEYLTDDNLINVEAGGTLTFENQHGDDYRLPVPSEEEYMIDLQSAIGG